MRHKKPNSNYLAKTESSEFDNLFRRINGLAMTWLDHNACILKSKQINLLVEHIKENRYFKPASSQTSHILTNQEYFLGQFIQTTFTLQDENTNETTKKRLRKHIEKILDAFDKILKENPIKPSVDLNKLNKSSKPDNTQEEALDSNTEPTTLWQRVKGFFR